MGDERGRRNRPALAARALEGLAEVATSAETTKAHLEAADLVSTMADHA